MKAIVFNKAISWFVRRIPSKLTIFFLLHFLLFISSSGVAQIGWQELYLSANQLEEQGNYLDAYHQADSAYL